MIGFVPTSLIETLIVLAILWLCGWLLKTKIEEFPNDYIPFVLIPLGIIMVWTLSPFCESFLAALQGGFILSLASIGGYTVLKNMKNSWKMRQFKKMTRRGDIEFRISISDIEDTEQNTSPCKLDDLKPE